MKLAGPTLHYPLAYPSRSQYHRNTIDLLRISLTLADAEGVSLSQASLLNQAVMKEQERRTLRCVNITL